MRKSKLFQTALLMIASIACLSAHAEEPAPAYRFELLIFKHTNPQTPGLENELKKVINPELKYRLTQSALDLFNRESGSDILHITDPSQFELADEMSKMQNSDLFEVLHHVVWQQPPLYRAQARHIKILEEPSKGLLKGVAWASYERYFQLRLDFQYDTTFAEQLKTVNTISPSDSLIPIHIKKIMSDSQLYYLDHPIIGVLAYISPVALDDSQ